MTAADTDTTNDARRGRWRGPQCMTAADTDTANDARRKRRCRQGDSSDEDEDEDEFSGEGEFTEHSEPSPSSCESSDSEESPELPPVQAVGVPVLQAQGYVVPPAQRGVLLVPYDSSDEEPEAAAILDSSDEEMTVRQVAERERQRRRGEAAEADAEAEDDDPPPTAPAGFELVDWSPGDSVEHFLLYSTVDRQAPQWHVGRVVKALPRSKQYTHDACLDGAPQARGVSLTAMLYDSPEGRYWYKLSPVGA